MTGPRPSSSWVTHHPKPAVLRKEPSVQAWHVVFGDEGRDQSVGSLGQGEVLSTAWPPLMSLPLSVAAKNHGETGLRLESSSGGAGRRAFLGVPSGADRTAASSRSRLRSSMGRVGGVSAASSPLGTEGACHRPAYGGGKLVEVLQEPLLAFPNCLDSVGCDGHGYRPGHLACESARDAVGGHDPGDCPEAVVSKGYAVSNVGLPVQSAVNEEA